MPDGQGTIQPGSLGELSPPRVQTPERWSLEQIPREWRPEIASSLGDYITRVEASLSSGTGSEREAAILAIDGFLASMGPEAVPTLGAILLREGSEEHRRRIVRTLGRLGGQSEEATEALQRFLLDRSGEPAASEELANVVKVMGLLQNKTSFDALLELVFNPRFPADLKSLAARSLSEHPRGGQESGLFTTLLGEAEDPALRKEAASALGRLRPLGVLVALLSALEKERDLDTTRAILASLGSIRDPLSLPPLEKKARLAAEKDIRLAAASAIASVGSLQALAILKDLAMTEAEPGVRRHLERWIEKLQ